MRLVLVIFFVEVGLVLAVVPWSGYWERNYFANVSPVMHTLVTNNFVRGAVSGLGVVNLVAAATELVSLFAARRSRDPIITR